jgi:chemotaxis methyl-accepting protein methylase
MDKSAFDTSSGAPASDAARSDGDAAAAAGHELILRRCGLAFRGARLPRCGRRARAGTGPQRLQRGTTRCSKPGEHASEWRRLVERLINHETSFFRHPPSFDALQRHILPELRDARPRAGKLNLWSAGCSTGQEAYSLAMVAMDDEALKGDFTVWGGDISRYAIDVARRGRYGPRAVATVRADYRQRFLRAVNDAASEYEIVDALRQRTRFMAANLVGNDTFSVSYDVIFCHNVLIYFSPAAVTQAVAFLASRLTLGGYLLLGPGEAPSERPLGLVQVSVNGVRAFQRRSARSTEVRA